MKISYKHLSKNTFSKPDLNELSEKLFQLGHEHEIVGDIFDFELTPNRGDCLSLNGLLRDLRQFYKISLEDIYKEDIKTYKFNFKNNAKKQCKKISFLKIEIDDAPKKYNGVLKDYFIDLDLKKNNFFTDVSNYISYETGQPTHCYDLTKIYEPITLDFLNQKIDFNTLLGKKITLNEDSLVFFDKNSQVINLAGIIGGESTSCDKNTKTVLVECAHFDPEVILGKALKYNLNSEAAHKFERNTDYGCHENVLRRMLKIIDEHALIKDVQIFTQENENLKEKSIDFNEEKINKILGTSISKKDMREILLRFGFKFDKKTNIHSNI